MLELIRPPEDCRIVDLRGRPSTRGRIRPRGRRLFIALEPFQVLTVRFHWNGED
jgi:hypothetical protein